ncbi:hypothetical protein DFH09DRAFT_943420, partial [Mycena vulgaris]
WKQLKHGFLHNHLRPRLDQLVWILITKVTPAYLACAQGLSDGHRGILQTATIMHGLQTPKF